MRVLFGISILVAFGLFSCSGKPTVDDLREELSKQVKSESEGRIVLSDVRVTSEEIQDVLGEKHHTLNYEATISFTENCFMYYNKSGYGPVFTSFKTFSVAPEFSPGLQMQIGSCVKGNNFTYSGSTVYVDRGEGWKAINKESLF